jgi:DNA-binding transcriptional MerR regulator
MAVYSIKDIEKLSGIKAHTIRIWEKRYKLVEPKRTDTNIRYYDDEDLKKLLNVALLNRNGHRISQIASLEYEELNKKVQNLSNEHRDNESRIDDLIISMIELDERQFEKVLSTAIMQSGFENTIIYTLYPFFEKIGVLWLTGAINPAQEHFISNLVRQKIIVAIDGIVDRSDSSSKHFLLYLPENELHELGLLFKYYLLKKRGHKVTYLGQSVPFEDIKKVSDLLSPDYVVTSFYTAVTGDEVNDYIEKLSESLEGKNIIFMNADPEFKFRLHNKNIFYTHDTESFNDLLGTF